jgi:hypothetical protein
MSNLSELLLNTVGRHLLTLSCVQRQPGISEERTLVISGFLVEAGGVWFYVTAGHILKAIRACVAGGVEFDIWRFDYEIASRPLKGPPIPYAFDIDKWLVIEDEEIGLDYATVPLETYYCRLLKAGGSIPIDKAAWGDHLTERDQWALIGIPEETVDYDQESIIRARRVVLPLGHAEIPEEAGRKAKNQFYARLMDRGNLTSIRGVSGGPVFGLKKVAGVWKYKVIGVQSGWYERDLIITACPFASFGGALEELVESFKASIEAHADPDQTAT